MKLRAILCLFLCGSSIAQRPDSTRIEGVSGRQVVQSVIGLIRESCLFSNDRMLLRRLAYVATDDGQDPSTYRPGFDGGIWAVTQSEFQQTKSDLALQPFFIEIRNRFNIDWGRVQWHDLRKPLYSGLAAALFLQHTFGANVLPSVERQAAWYQNHRFPGQAMAAYNFTVRARDLSRVCSSSNIDLAFLVDCSSSLSPFDFRDALAFAADVLDPFNVALNSVRVAFLTFSTGYKVLFDFDDFSNKAGIQAAIRGAQYLPGSTDTDLALEFASSQLFTPARGSRPTSAKVAVIVTDGKATHSSDAVVKAQQLQAQGVTVFVIGVGDQVDTDELNSLATQPNCTHVQLLTDYSDLDTLRDEIQQLSCNAPVGLTEGNYTYPCDSVHNFRIAIHGNETITVRPSQGKVDIYGSFNTPDPNSVFSEFHTQATTSREAIIYVRDESRPLYVSIVSHGSDVTLCPAGQTYEIIVQNKNALKPNAQVTCYSNGNSHQCSPLDILSALYTVIKPDALGFPNPCQAGHPGYFPHPTLTDRFLYCDYDGTLYIVSCPPVHWYNHVARACIPGYPPTLPPATTTPRPTTVSSTYAPVVTTPFTGQYNPCTVEALARGQHFFPYPPDPRKYYYCTGWIGQYAIRECAVDHRWSQHDGICIYIGTVVNPDKHQFVTSPTPVQVDCTPGLHNGDNFYHPHPTDPHKFIQCDQYGDAFIMECMGGRVWNQAMTTCT